MLTADQEAEAQGLAPAEALALATSAGVQAHHEQTGMGSDDVDRELCEAGADPIVRGYVVGSVQLWERTQAMSEGTGAQSAFTDQPTNRPAYTISEAQKMTGVSRSTLRRRLDEKAFPGAFRAGKSGEWRIPVEDLLAVGLRVNAPAPGEDVLTEQGQGGVPAAPDPGMAARVAELERLLAVEQVRREAAEQLAAERAERVEDLRGALRILEAGPIGRAQQAEQSAPAERRGWFRRKE